MADIFFKRDPAKKFTDTDEPLDNTDVPEGKPFPFEAASMYEPWGWYPFLYESPFTQEKFGALTIPAFDGGGDFGSGFTGFLPFVFSSGEVAPSGGAVGPSTVSEIGDAAKADFCDGAKSSENLNGFCQSVLTVCQFTDWFGKTMQPAFDNIKGLSVGAGGTSSDEEIGAAVDAYNDAFTSFSNVRCGTDFVLDANFSVISCDGAGLCAGQKVLAHGFQITTYIPSTDTTTTVCAPIDCEVDCAGVVCGTGVATLRIAMNNFLGFLETTLNSPEVCGCDLDFADIVV